MLTNVALIEIVFAEQPSDVTVSALLQATELAEPRRISLSIPKSDLDATDNRAEYVKGRLSAELARVQPILEAELAFAAAVATPYADDLAALLPRAGVLVVDETAPTGLVEQ